jgi:hypothetical protein
MANDKTPWFVVERSEALAGLLLTSREDVRVQSEKKHDDGVDFIVAIDTGEPLSTRLFSVQVKGATSSNPDDWMQNVKHLFTPSGRGFPYLPACVFVVNVKDNRSLYAWVAEPMVEERGVKLQFHQQGHFCDLDKNAVNEIVERVKDWYDALPKQFAPVLS